MLLIFISRLRRSDLPRRMSLCTLSMICTVLDLSSLHLTLRWTYFSPLPSLTAFPLKTHFYKLQTPGLTCKLPAALVWASDKAAPKASDTDSPVCSICALFSGPACWQTLAEVLSKSGTGEVPKSCCAAEHRRLLQRPQRDCSPPAPVLMETTNTAFQTDSQRDTAGFLLPFFYTLKMVTFNFCCLLPSEIKYLKKRACKILLPLITTQVDVSLNVYDNPAGWSHGCDW